MKSSIILGLAALANGHTIFQRLSVGGTQLPALEAIRVPTSNNPTYDVTSSQIACNTGYKSPVSQTVTKIPAGSQVGAWWGHIIGGAQYNPDPDNPIAHSHKGPVMVYLAKVDNAATAQPTGQKWFKIYEDGVDSSGQWGVDRMINANGWSNFAIPSCIAPGQYLMRVEIIALHSASKPKQAQFYMSCAQVEITGSGTFTPDSTVSFPGAYSANDPGILVNIYDAKGNPTMQGKTYTIPGPRPITC